MVEKKFEIIFKEQTSDNITEIKIYIYKSLRNKIVIHNVIHFINLIRGLVPVYFPQNKNFHILFQIVYFCRLIL